MIKLFSYISAALIFLSCPLIAADTPNQSVKPKLMLANSYDSQIDLSEYWVSEKYDGFRAYWDGKQLLSRQGNTFDVPQWFVESFPQQPLDGELWLGRGEFQTLASIIKTGAEDSRWHSVRYMVFDLPDQQQRFNQRLMQLKAVIAAADVAWLQAVEQEKVASEALLFERLQQVVDDRGEGLMLHLGSSFYRGYRSDDLIKLKQYADAEAKVIAVIAGKGKYQGLMGALTVQMPSGLQFNLGSGFTDRERANPPEVGTQVTYRYNGFTDRGIPRFARFLRRYQTP